MAKSEKIIFPEKEILAVMDSLRLPNGAFMAAPSDLYRSIWLRDAVYCILVYWYIGDLDKLRTGFLSITDCLKKYKKDLTMRIASPDWVPGGVLHSKYGTNFEKITTDMNWPHHQLDVIGLYLHTAADLDYKNVRIFRDGSDREILQLLVSYLRSVEYWEKPDFGMWEEGCLIRHSHAIGACVAGLKYLRMQNLAWFPDLLLDKGQEALNKILPYESRDKCPRYNDGHRHCCDSAQLSLIWPYHEIENPRLRDEMLSRLFDGHVSDEGEKHRLEQAEGFHRYWGDNYFRSGPENSYISAKWPIFKFWKSIVYSQLHQYEKANAAFKEACTTIYNGRIIGESFQGVKLNPNSPLAWAHAIAEIAFKKLPMEMQKELSEK